MDIRGITWVGNVYQKFEAMCLEVEEIIVQDTVKYVENQVQTVGATVKKFYSDVVQDFCPESSLDSGKSPPPSMLHEYAPVCSFTKRKESTDGEEATDIQKEQLTKDDTWVIRDQAKRNGSAMKLRGRHADDYSVCTSPWRFNNGSGLYRRTKLGAKQIFQKEKFPEVKRPYVVEKDSSLSTVKVPREKDLDVETVRSNDSPAEVERFISREPSHNKDDGDGNEHSFTVVNSIRSQNSETEQAVASSLPTGSDDCTMETNEGSLDIGRVSERNTELIQLHSQRPVEESCILVDRNEIRCLAPHGKKHGKTKSYKKIRDAVYSRMRSSREQEYEQLVNQWHAKDAETGAECSDIRTKLGFGCPEEPFSICGTATCC
ncbi:PREDICTED: uncharacterized protein LOC104800859 isoform X2 [Tarenaya hassleriana]|uniref:uncharacterized protein LOC104800859 isoform X2 n=1 Tax=Tarenaya hassleriana TaxID=28532 RepID=UPI00053C470F|nr:PREDICTED: uncharacterized protein LOC104800859 isoform X2 [Tarenaya hassleriana]XP_010522129.1 PREDICTED: uncharacterized protein LOC104800859 isoform X2 [Tarenaya hassleriana]XP_010522130.1 PREDICTED: uncharacterized protein LOC104800859 isoform X2 [Tarenaya hassleriana]XP_019056520.1 PREDICTED: uncharacterized protein LOC104800859 isoform X2 [Tarenaya hassleriana]